MSTPRLVEVRQNVLKQNDLLARAQRERFHQAGVRVISLERDFPSPI
jgi:hydrogenase nickel incorporation protein HypB